MDVERGKMARRQVLAGRGNRERRIDARDREPASQREGPDRRKLDQRPRKDERAQRRNYVSRRRARLTKGTRRYEAHVAVIRELDPGPAFIAHLVDGDAFALESLGIERRIRRGRTAQRRLRLDHLVGPTLNEARSLDLAFEMLGCQLRSRRRDARVERVRRSRAVIVGKRLRSEALL